MTLAGYGNTGVGDTGEEPHTFGKTLQFGQNRYDFDYDDVPWVYEYDFDKLGDDSFNVTDGPAVGSDEVDHRIGRFGQGGADAGGRRLGDRRRARVHHLRHRRLRSISEFGEKAGDTSVFAYRDWLNSELTAGSPPVPEPGTWALIGIGFVVVSFVARNGRPPSNCGGRTDRRASRAL